MLSWVVAKYILITIFIVLPCNIIVAKFQTLYNKSRSVSVHYCLTRVEYVDAFMNMIPSIIIPRIYPDKRF